MLAGSQHYGVGQHAQDDRGKVKQLRITNYEFRFRPPLRQAQGRSAEAFLFWVPGQVRDDKNKGGGNNYELLITNFLGVVCGPLALTPYRRGRGLSGLDDCLWQSLFLYWVPGQARDDKNKGGAGKQLLIMFFWVVRLARRLRLGLLFFVRFGFWGIV